MEIGLSVSPTRPWRTAGGPFSGHATLTSGLVSYWKLNEVSGDRADSVGSNTLTDNNTVTSVAGMRSLAAQFTAANLEYLSIASNSTLNFAEADGFSFTCWYNSTSGQVAASKDDEGANRQWLWNGGAFYYFDDGASFISVAASLGAGDLGVWRFLCVWYDPADQKLHFSKDNGVTADSAGTIATLKETNTEMRIGESAAAYNDGLMDEFGLWKRVLTAQERTDLYNAGAGLFY